ncbi:ATP-binding cassette domain-containing protein [Clostridium sp. MSJ-4]|uniref:ATP-binding cassette domain-containing protein n=1 Tax=Clostridium simiarum TaxID=2841506 RepID=A0ABS6F2E2_9CLOT|nr:oligopeptide/dipeptide ABC transporter ATP-binding protein [Clostridium simiarum]MBU5592681.1 ATP-binding cassette domain-containing protein [Clostridium simiarum]
MQENNKDILLEVKDLKKYFPLKSRLFFNNKSYVKSVDGVSFKIHKTKIMGLVGESGCGKSTVAKTILNLIEPTGGSVKFNDKTIFNVEKNSYIPNKRMNEIRKDMQLIFQDPYSSLNPRKTIEAIVSEGMVKYKMGSKAEIKGRCEMLLNLCGMDKTCLNRYPHEFSGGQRQRIGIARAISLSPQFIVCDEPTAALDVSIQSQILNLMLDLKEDLSLTYLFISHNLSVVRYFCDEICVMYLGVIVEKGPSAEIYDHPLHPYTKALISSMPISHPLQENKRILLTGSIPSAGKIPSGCKFNTRCKYATDRCREEIPELIEVSTNHLVACHNYNSI